MVDCPGPCRKLGQGTHVKVKLRVIEQSTLRKIFPSAVVKGTFENPTTTFVHGEYSHR